MSTRLRRKPSHLKDYQLGGLRKKRSVPPENKIRKYGNGIIFLNRVIKETNKTTNEICIALCELVEEGEKLTPGDKEEIISSFEKSLPL